MHAWCTSMGVPLPRQGKPGLEFELPSKDYACVSIDDSRSQTVETLHHPIKNSLPLYVVAAHKLYRRLSAWMNKLSRTPDLIDKEVVVDVEFIKSLSNVR